MDNDMDKTESLKNRVRTKLERILDSEAIADSTKEILLQAALHCLQTAVEKSGE